MPQNTVDRRALVRRHNPVMTGAHPTGVFSVGNGDVALSVDISGLQTFASYHEIRPDPYRVIGDGLQGLPEQRQRSFDPDDFQIPLRTQSSWGWYETRPVRPFNLAETVTYYDTPRGPVPYLDRMGLQRAADPIAEEFAPGAWFHYNPRRLHLGRLALVRSLEAEAPDPSDVEEARTELDLWSGRVEAAYTIAGERVNVTTVADPRADRFAVRVETSLLAMGWGVAWVFDTQPDDLAWFECPLREDTVWDERSSGHLVAARTVESTRYAVEVTTTGTLTPRSEHILAHTTDATLEVVVTLDSSVAAFAESEGLVSFSEVRAAAATWWREYWERGAIVSFEGSADERAYELERRIVLSQYLLAVNSAGSTPPAETGLTYNTWTGKFHLEMHWWHAAHFPMWGRGDMLERSLGFYHRALGAARSTAQQQGYRGGRWPKQTDPSARESPSNIGVFLVWQQPHIIHLLELLWREGRDAAFLQRHYVLVEATAEFMADFVEERDGSYVLPAPLVPAQESYLADRATAEHPTFELAYWSWALRVANEWRERLGLPANATWQHVSDRMRRPAVMPDGTYAAIATRPYLIREDHPSMLMALGWLPDTDLVDPAIMAATFESVWNDWDLQSTWGWDYPVLAMTAARLGDIGRAIGALLMRSAKNVFLPNGHNPQMPGFLSLYLPGNGGVLAATAHIIQSIQAGAVPPEGISIRAEGFDAARRDRLSAIGAH